MFYYLSAAALQYLAPTLLLLFSVLMLRTLGELKVEENRLHMSIIEKQRRAFLFRPFHPDIRSYILHTGLSSNPVVGTRRICLIIMRFIAGLVIISFFLMTFTFDSRLTLYGEIR